MTIGGLSIHFCWVRDGDGYTTRRTACLAGYHPPHSPTWRWALYWRRPGSWLCWPWAGLVSRGPLPSAIGVRLPCVGELTLERQRP